VYASVDPGMTTIQSRIAARILVMLDSPEAERVPSSTCCTGSR
jgi:hypothetical protein